MVIGDADIGFQLDIVAGQHTPDKFVVLALLRNDTGVGLMLIDGRQRRFQHSVPAGAAVVQPRSVFGDDRAKISAPVCIEAVDNLRCDLPRCEVCVTDKVHSTSPSRRAA